MKRKKINNKGLKKFKRLPVDVKIANYMFNKEQHFFRVSKHIFTNYLLSIRKKIK